jgi:hypothetical protein
MSNVVDEAFIIVPWHINIYLEELVLESEKIRTV